jgi:hypothetical protein
LFASDGNKSKIGLECGKKNNDSSIIKEQFNNQGTSKAEIKNVRRD